jgi:nicotinamidase-related amidase
MLLEADDSQLVLVDYQQRLMPSIHEADAIVANALRLARVAALLEVPVWGTEENPPASARPWPNCGRCWGR